MTDTLNLGLPLIDAAQAQKHVTHNEALGVLDALVQLSVISRALSAPPSTPAEGDCYVVKATGTGAFAGKNNQIAQYYGGGWLFYPPRTGWLAYVANEGILIAWNGSAWVSAVTSGLTALQNLALLGIGTTADSTNPFSAKLNNALWIAKTTAEGGDGTLRFKLSKESAAKTLSILFQDNFSGRAEIGLTGDDDFHFKVSPDGSSWVEGLKIAAATGKVSFPSGTIGIRELLAADRTYYIRTDGNDANDGLSNSAGGAFLTIQKAADVVFGTLDLSKFNVVIQLVDGTYAAGGNATSARIGTGTVTIQGNATHPENVIVSVSSIGCFRAASGAALIVKDMELRTTGSVNCLVASVGGVVQFGNIRFGASGNVHIRAEIGGLIEAIGDYAIVGNAGAHYNFGLAGVIRVQNRTITLTGTPAFSTAFAQGTTAGQAVLSGNTYSGAAAGLRYNLSLNSAINTGGASTTYLPGDTAGTTATGGQYG